MKEKGWSGRGNEKGWILGRRRRKEEGKEGGFVGRYMSEKKEGRGEDIMLSAQFPCDDAISLKETKANGIKERTGILIEK